MSSHQPAWQKWHDETEPIRIGISSCLLGHHVAKHRITYLEDQLYLEPHPRELMLRNRV